MEYLEGTRGRRTVNLRYSDSGYSDDLGYSSILVCIELGKLV